MTGPVEQRRTFLCFDVAGGRYGIDSLRVAEVGRPPVVARVPGAPAFVQGVASHRGHIIPVLDAAARLCLVDEAGEDSGERGHAVYIEGERGVTGLLVDDIVEIVDIGAAQIDPTPGVVGGSEEFYEGIARCGDRLVGLLSAPDLSRFDIGASLIDRVGALSTTSTTKSDVAPDQAKTTDYAVVRAGDDEMAVEATAVVEVLGLPELERTGDLPPYVLGLTEHRGAAIPVIDLHRRVAEDGTAFATPPETIIVVRSGDHVWGVAVHAVVQLLRLTDDEVRPTPAIISGVRDHIRAVAVLPREDRVIAIVDHERLVRPEHVTALEQAGADAMEHREQKKADAVAETEFVIFRSAGIEFALPSSSVHEILSVPEITWMPYAPKWIRGLFQTRGEVLAAIDLRARLDVEGSADEQTLIVIRHAGVGHGLLVDSLSEMRRVPTDQVSDPPEIVSGVQGQFLGGIFSLEGRSVLVLSAATLTDRAIDLGDSHAKQGTP